MAKSSRVTWRHSNNVVLLVSSILLLAAIILGILFTQKSVSNKDTVKDISSYAECIAATGSIVQESYPERCVAKTGESFTNPDQTVSPPPSN